MALDRDAPPPPRILPLAVQNLREVRERGCYYVDKTDYARKMADEGKHYFLSRPRRFGKSLLVDTLKEIFEGNEPLFRGLAIHDRWDWSRANRSPAVRISFAAGDLATTEGLERRLGYLLFANEERLGLARRIETAAERFSDLLVRLHSKTGRRVVVLVDEYDKPILDALGAPEIAEANRDRLASVFSVVKDLDEHVRFSFFTGVTKFSKANLFSTLNNLTDISLDPAFAAVCGFTDAELDAVFADPLAALDVDRDAVREWYNGYNWLGEDPVYCPYDVLNLFRTGLVRNYWIKTGTPAFLPSVLVDRGIQAMEQSARWIDEDRLEDFDIGRMDTAALLFQTGYLTIAREHDSIPGRYWLDYPNREVGQSLSQLVVAEMLGEETRFALADDFRNAVASVDFRMLHATLSSVLAGVPYDHYRATPLARIEGHYAAVMDTAARMAGLNPRSEESTASGRTDMTVEYAGQTMLFEWKVVHGDPTGQALAQLRSKRYAEKYRHRGASVHLIGVEFDSRTHAIVGFDTAPAFPDLPPRHRGGGSNA